MSVVMEDRKVAPELPTVEPLPVGEAIRVEGLTVAYDATPVLTGVDVSLPSLKITGIVGPNGAGKSTLLKTILGIVPQSRGTVRFGPVAATEPDHGCDGCGRNLATIGTPKDCGMSLKRRACDWWACNAGACVASPVAYVPQRSTVDWDFPTTVFDTVLMGTYGRLRFWQRPGADQRRAAEAAIETVGLQDLRKRPIGELSGGQQQRTFLARALAQEASVYLLDEPFAGVDATTESLLVDVLRKLRDAGKTIAMVHHDLSSAMQYFDHVVMLNRRVVACGDAVGTLTAANIATTYAG